MSNARPTTPGSNALPSSVPAPIRASARFWKKIATADLPWDASTAHGGIPCDGVQVQDEGCQMTGVPGGQKTGAVQNAPYSANVRYPDSYYTVTVISSGNVWLYWFEDPTV